MSQSTGFDLSGSASQPAKRPDGDERTLAIIVHVLSIFFWIVDTGLGYAFRYIIALGS